MTRDEALQAMIDGEKVTHRFFTSDEYIYMIAQDIYMEDDVCVGTTTQHFWVERGGRLGGEAWETDWSIYEEN